MAGLTRRSFLKQSGGAAAALAAGVTIISSRARGANERIGAAVMGVNGRGTSHLEAFTGMADTQVVAICDVDERIWEARAKLVTDRGGAKPKFYADIRQCLEDPAVDVVSIATPNHWHSLGAIWACDADKDVYVEKPCSWCIREGRRLVEIAHRRGRIVQHGTQSRSDPKVRTAIARLHAGEIGKVYMARALCYKPRWSIGFKEPKAPPAELHWDLWLGPAPEQPYHENLVHYNWHWFWDFGNGDIGNQGVHQMDVARWGLGKGLPVQVQCGGGRLGYKDQGQTPNTELATFTYDDGSLLVFEVRGLPSNDEGGDKVGNLFYGAGDDPARSGFMVSGDGYQGHFDYNGETAEKAGLELPPVGGSGTPDPFANFIEAVRSRRREDLNAEVLEGHLSAALCHLANIAYRVGRALKFDPETETFPGDEEANALLTRPYREPFTVR